MCRYLRSVVIQDVAIPKGFCVAVNGENMWARNQCRLKRYVVALNVVVLNVVVLNVVVLNVVVLNVVVLNVVALNVVLLNVVVLNVVVSEVYCIHMDKTYCGGP